MGSRKNPNANARREPGDWRLVEAGRDRLEVRSRDQRLKIRYWRLETGVGSQWSAAGSSGRLNAHTTPSLNLPLKVAGRKGVTIRVFHNSLVAPDSFGRLRSGPSTSLGMGPLRGDS
jgi:hypothetical protein